MKVRLPFFLYTLYIGSMFEKVNLLSDSIRYLDGPDTVVLIVIPILCVLFVTAIFLAIVMWFRHKRRQKRYVSLLTFKNRILYANTEYVEK